LNRSIDGPNYRRIGTSTGLIEYLEVDDVSLGRDSNESGYRLIIDGTFAIAGDDSGHVGAVAVGVINLALPFLAWHKALGIPRSFGALFARVVEQVTVEADAAVNDGDPDAESTQTAFLR
jgi:hypothetical protein